MKNKINIERTLEYLLYLFVFLIPLQTRWIFWGEENFLESARMSWYSFDIILVLLIILFLLTKKVTLPNKKLTIFILLLIVLSLLSIVWAGQKELALYWSIRLMFGFLIVLILQKINFSFSKLSLVFSLGLVPHVLLGLYQLFCQKSFAFKWLGLAYHSAAKLGDVVVETTTGRWLRVYGGMPHPNILAGFLVLAVLLLIFSKIKYKYLLILPFVFTLFFTFSRAAWLVFIILSLVLLIKKIEWRVVLASLLLFLILSLIFLPLVKIRVVAEQRLEVKSNMERVAGYGEAWQIIKQHPFLGVGIGNYTYELQKMSPGQPAWAYQPVHTVYLLVMSELGLVGFLFITLLLYYFIRELRIKNYELRFVFLCFCVFVFLCFFDHFWWTLPSGMLLWWLILGLGLTNFLVIL